MSCKSNQDKLYANFRSYGNLEKVSRYHKYLSAHLDASDKSQAACLLIRHGMRRMITGAGNKNKTYIKKLIEDSSLVCDSPKTCAAKFYDYMKYLISLCRINHPVYADKASEFIEWQSILKTSWGKDFFDETKVLLKSSWKAETELVILGALRNFLEVNSKKRKTAALTAFIRILGFSCGELSPFFTDKGATATGEKYPALGGCIPTCKHSSITEPMFDFRRRRGLILKHCKPADVAVSSVKDMKYLSKDNYLVFKNAKFINSLFNDVEKRKSGFVKANIEWINKLKSDYAKYSLYLSYAELSKQERGFVRIPFSFAAYMMPQSEYYAVIDSFFNVRFGKRPLYKPFSGEIQGTPYPGEVLPGDGESVLSAKIASVRANPSLLLDAKMPQSVLLKIASLIKRSGYSEMELIMKNQYDLLRAFRLKIIDVLPEKYVLIHVGPGLMTVTSSFKVFKKDKYDSDSPYDFSGLRQRLERIRWRHRHKVHIVIKTEPGMLWSSIAKLIGYLTQNTSGRKLFENISLLITEKLPPSPSGDSSVKDEKSVVKHQ